MCVRARKKFHAPLLQWKFLWTNARKGKESEKKQWRCIEKNMFFYIYIFFSQFKSVWWFTISKCTCMHDSLFLSCSCSFARYLVSVLFTAIITVFFTKWHHKILHHTTNWILFIQSVYMINIPVLKYVCLCSM